MSYQVGLDIGSARTTVAVGGGATTTRTRRHASTAAEVVAALDELTGRYGEPPSRVAMTHRLAWDHHALEELRAELIEHGRADILFVPEPHAAVRAFDEVAGVPEHSAVAVFDFGASRCDIAVLRKQGVFMLAGRPETVDIGGRDIDDLVVEHVGARAGAKSAELRNSCTEAKELLGSYPEVRIPVVAPDVPLDEARLSRLAFEAIIRPAVELAVDALERVARTAGLHRPDVVLLVGGSARIPLVAREIAERLRIPTIKAPDGATAAGAALEAVQLEPEPVETPTVWVPKPREEDRPKKRVGVTPFLAAGLIALAAAGGFAAHEVMKQPPRVTMESVELPPPGTAVLPAAQP